MLAPLQVEASPKSAAPSIAREFAMRADFRRCAWYAAIGLIVVLSVGEFLRANGLAPQANPNRTWVDKLICAGILASASVGLLLATHTWRLRIDESGIARRRLWWWDHWTWDEFSEGHIRREKGKFHSKQRPFWRNGLDLSLLEDRDHEFVLQACKHFFQVAEAEQEFPGERELIVNYQLVKSITLHQTGIAARMGGRTQDLDWSQIKQIRLLHIDDWTHRLRKMEFELARQTLIVEGVQVVKGGYARTYKVTQQLVIPSVVEWFLRKHAPPDKLVSWSLSGPPGSLAECHYRRQKAQKALVGLTWFTRLAPLGVLVMSLCVMGQGIWACIIGQVAFPHVGWRILVAAIGVLTVTMQPLLIWLLGNYACARFRLALKELNDWDRENSLRAI